MPADLITGQWPTSGPGTPSGTGDIIGSSANYWSAPYGGVPMVPDPISSQFASLTGNLENLGSLERLAGGINTFGAQQARGQYEANLPGYDQMMQEASGNILADLAGVIDPDVMNLLQQSAAERGIGSVGAESPNAGAQYLRAIGQTAYQRKAAGQQELTSAIQRTPTSPLFNVASMLTSPTDMQAARMAANLYAAAPDPQAAAEEAIRNAEEAMKFGASLGGGTGGTRINLAGAAPPNTGGNFGPAVSPYPSPILPGLNPGTGTAAGTDPWAAWARRYMTGGSLGLPGQTGGTDWGLPGIGDPYSGENTYPGGWVENDPNTWPTSGQDWFGNTWNQQNYGPATYEDYVNMGWGDPEDYASEDSTDWSELAGLMGY